MMAFTGRDDICSDYIFLIRQRMFRVADIIKNVKYTVLHKDELIICYKDQQGIAFYKGDAPVKVSGTAELTEQGFRTADYYFLAKQDNHLYIASGYGKSLYAFNIDTAKIEWKQPVVTEAGWISDLKLYNDRLFVTDESDNLHVFKRT